MLDSYLTSHVSRAPIADFKSSGRDSKPHTASPEYEIRPFKAETSNIKKSIARDLIKDILRTHAPSSLLASSKPGAMSPPFSLTTGSFSSRSSEHVGRKHADFRSVWMRSKSPSTTAKSPLQPDSRASLASKAGGVSLWND
ncbi:hypothetical protein DY000_02061877 [Brassica cretica]|uniref:DUF4005 domain-containing protein n=1 Tax=Brassica cretica TaxID=69181 RepID=A0ABQ7ARV6_BRACR|nr:hypothetical protein DY000_02061877 [Brassica cretica]